MKVDHNQICINLQLRCHSNYVKEETIVINVSKDHKKIAIQVKLSIKWKVYHYKLKSQLSCHYINVCFPTLTLQYMEVYNQIELAFSLRGAKECREGRNIESFHN